VVNSETMALMSRPEPMPVEVMTAFAAALLDAVLEVLVVEPDVEVVGVVVEAVELVGDMTELI